MPPRSHLPRAAFGAINREICRERNPSAWILASIICFLQRALLGTFFSGTATRIVAISMPTVAQSLGTDLLGVSWALLSYQLSNIGLSVIFGRISDLWGREKMFALGFLVFSSSSLLFCFSQTVLQLIVSSFVQGIGGAKLQSWSLGVASG